MKTYWATAIIILSLVAFAGCNTPKTYRALKLDANTGRAYETARFSQIANPDAEGNLEAVQGFDGSAAWFTMDKYQKDFMKEETTTKVFNIYTQSK